MNIAKKIKRRVRNIIQAAMGKPVTSITVGVDIKNCDDCSRGRCEECAIKHSYERLYMKSPCAECGAVPSTTEEE